MAEEDENDPSQRLFVRHCIAGIWIEEGKQILLENTIRQRRKYALLRGKGGGDWFSPRGQRLLY